MKRAHERFFCSGLGRFTAYQVCNDDLNLGFGTGRKGRLKVGYVRDTCGALGGDFSPLEMLYQRVEAAILRNNVEVRGRVLGRKDAYVVGDVEIDGVVAGSFQ